MAGHISAIHLGGKQLSCYGVSSPDACLTQSQYPDRDRFQGPQIRTPPSITDRSVKVDRDRFPELSS
jgi:hypothetical protein